MFKRVTQTTNFRAKIIFNYYCDKHIYVMHVFLAWLKAVNWSRTSHYQRAKITIRGHKGPLSTVQMRSHEFGSNISRRSQNTETPEYCFFTNAIFGHKICSTRGKFQGASNPSFITSKWRWTNPCCDIFGKTVGTVFASKNRPTCVTQATFVVEKNVLMVFLMLCANLFHIFTNKPWRLFEKARVRCRTN